MSKDIDAEETKSTSKELPRPKIQKSYWPLPLVWLAPLAAAVFAGYLFYNQYKTLGPEITVTFGDASDIKPGQTPVECRGVQIGEVSSLALSPDFHTVLLKIRLQRSDIAFAQKGALYWVVRPEVGNGVVSGLGTVFSGPYIEALPGHGEEVKQFTGFDREPAEAGEQTLKIVLRATDLGYLKPDSAIYFRGIQVGAIERYELSHDASFVVIHGSIRSPYSKLVTADSVFWNVSGADVSGGLFSGINVKIESLQSLLGGGVAFATPSSDAAPAKDGAEFSLYDKPKKEWLDWAPNIALPSAKNQPVDKNNQAQDDQLMIRSGKIEGAPIPPR